MLLQKTKHLKEVDQAARHLQAGAVIGFPTETVYGLGALQSHPQALRQIFSIKGRDSSKPLMAHIASLDDLDSLDLSPPKIFYALAEAFWPGPLAIILKRNDGTTLGVRMPDHPLALELIEKVGEPIMATSANLSGRPSPKSVEEVLIDLEGKIPAILDGGPCPFAAPSTILSLVSETPQILRVGPISEKSITDTIMSLKR